MKAEKLNTTYYPVPDFVLHIEQGKITNRKKVKQVFEDLEDGTYMVKIDAFKKRSLQQNKYYWYCVVPIVKDGLFAAGYDDVKSNIDAHEVLKMLFLKKKIVNHNTGELIIEIAGSTSKLGTIQFNAFIDEVIKWGAEYLGVQIPLPNKPLLMFAEHDNEVDAIIVNKE